MNGRAVWLAMGRGPRNAASAERAGPLDEAMMGRALALAKAAADQGEVPVGAIVYDAQGTVWGEGANRREADHDPSAHAEMIAIRQACAARRDWRLEGCALAVTLEPCAMCAGLIVNARVERLVYGTPDPKAGAAGSLYRLTQDPRLNHRVTPITGVGAERASGLLSAFFQHLRGRHRARTPRG